MAAVFRAAGLDHDREAQLLGGGPGVVGADHRPAVGHGHAHGAEELAGQLLVAGDGRGDRPGPVGLGGGDPPLEGPVAELDEALAPEPAVRDVTPPGRRDQGRGARAGAYLPGQVAKPLDLGRHVEGPVVQGGQDQLARRLQAGEADRLLLVLEDDPVDPLLRGHAGPAVADRRAGQALQFQRDVLEDMGRVGPLVEPDEEPAPVPLAALVLDHRGQPRLQPVVEAGDGIRRGVLERPELHPGLDHRGIGPDVRTPQDRHFPETHGRVLSRMRIAVRSPGVT